MLAARVRVWTASQSDEVRRRSRQLADEPRIHFDAPRFPPLAGGQHGRNRITLDDAEAQLERARAVLKDPKATESAKNAARKRLETQRKKTGDKRNRQANDAKPAPVGAKARAKADALRAARRAARKAAEAEAEQTAEVARRAAEEAARAKLAEMDHGVGGAGSALAAAGTVATGVWWAGKLLSPACGPAALVCAAVL